MFLTFDTVGLIIFYQEAKTMRSRGCLFVVSFLLLLTLAACSKPASNTAANPADQNTAPAAQPGAAGGSAASSSAAHAGESAKKPVEAPPIVVPAGTTLTVRLGQAVGSKISQPGESFSATLSAPVEVNGNTVIPRGASASGVVVDAKPLGRFKGGAVLEVKLNSITVNGSEKSIETSAVTRTEKGKGKRTAVLAGGGAGLGAIIGGLAGGGKGAAIGALAGGGAGTGGAAFTGNKDIVLPAESALSFRLISPLEVRPAQ